MTTSSNVRHKRYFVFAGVDLQGRGGWGGFVLASDDPEKATKAAETCMAQGSKWAEVIDLEVSLPVWRRGFD